MFISTVLCKIAADNFHSYILTYYKEKSKYFLYFGSNMFNMPFYNVKMFKISASLVLNITGSSIIIIKCRYDYPVKALWKFGKNPKKQ